MVLPSFSVLAGSNNKAEELLNCKVKEFNCVNTQGFIDGYLSDSAGIFSEWYVIALAAQGEYDFFAYESALLKYLSENKVTSASSRLKYAYTLLAIGSKSDYIAQTVEDSVGEQGIMSYVFGLHLLNNGQSCTKFTNDDIISTILSLECTGGGWSLTGQTADTDVSAMVIQALAPYYANNENVKASIDRAVAVISSKQLDDGDFLSYGVANPESGAQVIIALTSLGIDPATDARFIKNTNTLFDGIEKYKLENGSYCHKIGLAANENATSQVFLAYTAYQRFLDGKGSLYLIDKKQEPSDPNPPQTSVTTQTQISTTPNTQAPTLETNPSTQQSENADKIENKSKVSYKTVAVIVILAACIPACLILLVSKRGTAKNIIAVLAACALLIAFVLATDFQSADDYYSGDTESKENAVGVVKMSILCDKIVNLTDKNYIPKDGVILEKTEFEIKEGDTVYDILIEAAKTYKIQIENNGTDQMAYIAGINYIYEMDFGDLSGWVFLVNGESSSVSCSEYVLKDGDVIVWHYTLELGNDIN